MLKSSRADGGSSARPQARQGFEDGGAAVRVVAGDDFAFRLVVHEHPRQAVGDEADVDQFAVDLDAVGGADQLAELGDFTV